MGLNPYDPNEMTESLTQFLEQTFTDPDLPLVRDLTEIARPDSIAPQWSWVNSAGSCIRFLSDRRESLSQLPKHGNTPAQYGYRLAEMVREKATMPADVPVDSVEALGTAVLNKTFRSVERNHVPGSGLQAIVGHTADAFIAAGPLPARPDNRRFRLARGLYHAVAANDCPRRLVTGAFSWDQKASRAFAAELLAPQQALAARVSNREVDSQIIQELSTQYVASTMVIEQQLKNAGVAVSPE